MIIKIMGVNFRILEIHIFYNCGLFYWHLIEILWLFIFLVFYYSGFYHHNIFLCDSLHLGIKGENPPEVNKS